MDPTRTARLEMLGAAALFSTGGAAIKACGLPPWAVVCFRSGVAAIAILLMSRDARRGWTWKTPLVGVAYATTVVLFVLSNRMTTSANAIFLQSTAALHLLLIGPLLLHEPIRRSDVAFMAALAVGMTFFFLGGDAQQKTAPNPPLGNLLAVTSGLSWAFTIAGLRWLGKSGEGAAAATVAGNTLACLVALPFAFPLGETTPTDWALVIFLGVVQIGLAYRLLTSASRHVPALEATLLLLLEPVLNPIWSWIVHGETPGLWPLVGGVVILATTTARALATPPADATAPHPPS